MKKVLILVMAFINLNAANAFDGYDGAIRQSPENLDSMRDGSHDFDFAVGTWKTHIRRLLHPLTGSHSWIELNGIVVTRKTLSGHAELEEIEADGPSGHFEGMNLFLYNPHAHQWSLNWSSSKDGVIGVPTIGSFSNGIGEMYDQETINGKTVLVRGVWSAIKERTHHFEQAYSEDGGKTWETNFIAEKTLENTEPIIMTTPVPASNPLPAIAAVNGAVRDGSHDFDFDFGSWHIHMRRLRHPLTDSSSWFEMDGITRTTKVWGGKANLAEVVADGPGGRLELLALRLYNPQAHQWTINFATSNSGVLSVPCTGEFINGAGEFIDQEPYGDRTILVKFNIQVLTANTVRTQQAFSNDGGRTWETNWINDITRIND